MNRIILSGRLTANPELKKTTSNKSITRFTLAVQRKYKNAMGEYESDFIRCIAFNNTAELICNYLQKGNLIGIEGRIQTGSYTKEDGTKNYTTDIVVDNIDFYNTKPKEKTQTPYDYQEPVSDPYADFGEQVSIDDNFLD